MTADTTPSNNSTAPKGQSEAPASARPIYAPQKLRATLAHKSKQTKRFTKQSFETVFLIIGAGIVSICALAFAKLADFALHLNSLLFSHLPLLTALMLPFGLCLILYLTRRYAPFTSGSGIPQVIAAIHLPHSGHKTRLVAFRETLLKIPLTFLGMLFGASIGREGPSVQVGAAAMVAWGRWCRKHNYAFRGLEENNLLAIGAAGGLAAAFNAPLAGVTFAIEELGRGKPLRWERGILVGVVASGLFLISIEGNSPYFQPIYHRSTLPHALLWVTLCAVICGITGGLFARFLGKGAAGYLPKRLKKYPRHHPYITAFLLGIILAILGLIYHGQTYGTGYKLVEASMHADPSLHYGTLAFGKWSATIASYWAGIPGGIFTPCLTIGAVLGQTIAAATHFAAPSDILVLLCTAAFLAAATQSPLTSSVIVMEMTSTQNLLFWMLITSIGAAVVSRQFQPKPFYHLAAGRFIDLIRNLQQKEMHAMHDHAIQEEYPEAPPKRPEPSSHH